jgi:ribokinase
MTSFDVVGFGALNVDKLFKVNRIAKAEEESFIKTCEESCGGSAANTSVGLARLGCKVGFIGKVGTDHEGALLMEDFRREGVDTNGIVCAEGGESGTVMGFVDEHGQRALYINSGVNDNVTLQEIGKKYVSQTKFLHLTSFVGEKSLQTQKKLLETLHTDVKISFDPGALYAGKGYAELEPIIRKAHVMMPNAIELELITGKKTPADGAAFLIGNGVKIVAVKLGAKGCFVTDGKERHHMEAFDVSVVDTTGAGDAFCAGFLYGLLKKKQLAECGRIGNFVASQSVTKMGARAGLPYQKDLESLDKVRH